MMSGNIFSLKDGVLFYLNANRKTDQTGQIDKCSS